MEQGLLNRPPVLERINIKAGEIFRGLFSTELARDTAHTCSNSMDVAVPPFTVLCMVP